MHVKQLFINGFSALTSLALSYEAYLDAIALCTLNLQSLILKTLCCRFVHIRHITSLESFATLKVLVHIDTCFFKNQLTPMARLLCTNPIDNGSYDVFVHIKDSSLTHCPFISKFSRYFVRSCQNGSLYL